MARNERQDTGAAQHRAGANDGSAPAEPGGPAALAAARVEMTAHAVQSRVDLMASLARCSGPAEAGAVMTRWVERRFTEFGADQARLVTAIMQGLFQTATAASGAFEAANGLARSGLDAAAGNGASRAHRGHAA